MSERFVVLSGCSGGGKSSVLAELARRRHAVVDEPGRRTVRQALAQGGQALPWSDPAAFARRTLEAAIADHQSQRAGPGWIFFDRSVVDAAAALETATGEQVLSRLGLTYRYGPKVFFAPPWREIYVQDAERRHGFEDALAEYERLQQAYAALGYSIMVLPKAGVQARAALMLAELEASQL